MRTLNFLDRRLLSLGLFQTWLFIVFHSSLIISFESNIYSYVYSTTLLAAIVTLVVTAFIPYHRRTRILFLAIGTVLAVVGTCGIYFFPFGNLGFALYSICLGVGTGSFIPFVGKIFSSATLQTAARQTFLSFGLAVALYFLILGLPEIVGVLLATLLPIGLMAVILSIVLFGQQAVRSSMTGQEHDKVREILKSRPVIGFFLGVALLGAAFGFSMAFCSHFGSDTFSFANLWAVLLTGILSAVYFVFIRSPKWTFDFQKHFSPITPIIVIGLLLLAYSPAVSSVLIIAGFQLADIIIWVVFCWIAGHSGLPQRVFCIGKAAMYSGMLAGSFAGRIAATNPDLSSISTTVATIVAYLLVIAIAFIFANSKVTLAIKTSSSDSDMNYIVKAIELRCEELGQKYGLTMREKEVFAFLMQGRSLPYIERVMHISHGTANSHRDHIYSKINVHSKQELLDLFLGQGQNPANK